MWIVFSIEAIIKCLCNITDVLSTLTNPANGLGETNINSASAISRKYQTETFGNQQLNREQSYNALVKSITSEAEFQGSRTERQFGGNPFGVNVGALGSTIAGGENNINTYLELQRRSGLIGTREGVNLGIIGENYGGSNSNLRQGIKNQSLTSGAAALQQYDALKKQGFTDDDAASLLGVDKSVFSNITKQGSQNILNQFQSPSSILSSLNQGRGNLDIRGRIADDKLIRNIENVQNGPYSDVNKRLLTGEALFDANREAKNNPAFSQLTSGLSKRFGVQAGNTPEDINNSANKQLEQAYQDYKKTTDDAAGKLTTDINKLITTLGTQIGTAVAALNGVTAELAKLELKIQTEVKNSVNVANGVFNNNSVTVENGTITSKTSSLIPGTMIPKP